MSFGGKAFTTYVQAKTIVNFVIDVGATINHDLDIGDLLKVAANILIPGSDLSQHISCWNGGKWDEKHEVCNEWLHPIGTLDGAYVKIRQEVGEDNFFIFGDEAHEIADLRKERSEGKTGVMVMVHGHDKSLVLPSKVSEVQVIVLCLSKMQMSKASCWETTFIFILEDFFFWNA